MQTIFWLRDEVKQDERRAALTPTGASALIQTGAVVMVEKSSTRIFADAEYLAAGCELVEGHSWVTAPKNAYILGLKELPEDDFPLQHKHIYFAHAYKGQDEAPQVLARFDQGKGEILDLEFLQDISGRRVCAFGYWAGYVGAAIGFAGYCHRLNSDSTFPAVNSYSNRDVYLTELKLLITQLPQKPTALVIGAYGRSGRGAVDLFADIGIEAVQWDINETKAGGPFTDINNFDILVNCAYLAPGTAPFITPESLGASPRLSMVSDVSCDPNNPDNPIRIYTTCTKLTQPIVQSQIAGIEVQAVDHLPTVLPKESSEDFAEQLLPHLLTLSDNSDPGGVWLRANGFFNTAISAL